MKNKIGDLKTEWDLPGSPMEYGKCCFMKNFTQKFDKWDNETGTWMDWANMLNKTCQDFTRGNINPKPR